MKSQLQLKKGNPAVITAEHDEFSWRFGIDFDEENIERIEPNCSCMFHKVNSRNRIILMNQRLEVYSKLSLVNDLKENSYLFLGDHNLTALTVGSLKASTIYLLQEDAFCHTSVKNFVGEKSKIRLIKDFSEIGKPITHIIAEPYYNSAVLPWDHMTKLWNQIDRLRQIQSTGFELLPSKASIFTVPVRFLNLHKIRWPLKSTCEGFNHDVFDEFVEISSSLADENVEPFSLWEYPCIALNTPTKIYEMSFDARLLTNNAAKVLVGGKEDECNGLVFWVDWSFDDATILSSGPSAGVEIGEQISWSLHERQACHLIPWRKQTLNIAEIDIEIQYNKTDQKLTMDFKYNRKLE